MTYCIRDSNVDNTFQDYRAELVHNLYHWSVIVLQSMKSQPVYSAIKLLLFCYLIFSHCTSDCLMVTKRLRISLRMEMASLRVLS